MNQSSEVKVVASFKTWEGELFSIEASEYSGCLVMTINEDEEFELSQSDADTLIGLLTAYRDGFEFPPKPVDPTVDTTSAFDERDGSRRQCHLSDRHIAHEWTTTVLGSPRKYWCEGL